MKIFETVVYQRSHVRQDCRDHRYRQNRRGIGADHEGFRLSPARLRHYRNPACLELELEYLDLAQLLQQSDIVSLHCPLTPESRHLINAETIALMKRGSMLINTARGALVDASAMVDALKSREHIWYFGIDVYEEEGPLFFADRSSTVIRDDIFARLTTLPNVVITGHQAFLTRDALTKIAEITLGNVKDYEDGKPRPENQVIIGH